MKQHKASILAVTLIVLGIVLLTALTISGVALRQRMASVGTGRSNQAFQNADTGVEEVMKDIMNKSGMTVNNLANCQTSGTYAGKIVGNGYVVDLKKQDAIVSCTDPSIKVTEISAIKSTGSGADQESRAIEAAVAAGLTWNDPDHFNTSDGWGNYGNGYQNVQCARDPHTNMVYLKGLAYQSTVRSDSIVVYLPGPTCCPAARSAFASWGHNGSQYVLTRIDVHGGSGTTPCAVEMIATNTGSGSTWAALDGISYPGM